ncbi:helix-turn-helix transcriptional regulator [Gemmobacter denitrificans]|uniref:Helix-turn-helix transcriptional regulator n=1 Tax=Gemmobacter denitrificans TaxID=3123040 RepID=A0ABU8BWY6_9RHOB
MSSPYSRQIGLVALILFQIMCVAFFIGDVIEDVRIEGWSSIGDAHIMPELGATAGLVLGVAFEIRYLLRLLRRQSQLERQMSVAAGALHEVMETYFRDWKLTPSEQDIAAFTIKGYSIAEIAGFRGSAEATIKTHLNAIYRKAGVTGRGQLTSLLIEDLLRAPLVGAGESGETPLKPASSG